MTSVPTVDNARRQRQVSTMEANVTLVEFATEKKNKKGLTYIGASV